MRQQSTSTYCTIEDIHQIYSSLTFLGGGGSYTAVGMCIRVIKQWRSVWSTKPCGVRKTMSQGLGNMPTQQSWHSSQQHRSSRTREQLLCLGISISTSIGWYPTKLDESELCPLTSMGLLWEGLAVDKNPLFPRLASTVPSPHISFPPAFLKDLYPPLANARGSMLGTLKYLESGWNF